MHAPGGITSAVHCGSPAPALLYRGLESRSAIVGDSGRYARWPRGPRQMSGATTPPRFGSEEVRFADIVLYGGLVLWFILVAITRKDADRRGLHDRIADTLVMRVP